MTLAYIKVRTNDPDPLAYHGGVKLDLEGHIIDESDIDDDAERQNEIVDEEITAEDMDQHYRDLGR